MNARGKEIARSARGFSLLELTLVLAIIGILMAIAAYNIFGQGEQARIKATRASMDVIKNAIGQYQLNTAMYPPDLETLKTGRASYLDPNKPLVDGWNQPFVYGIPGHDGQPYDLFSKGPDGTLGTPDDLNIWKPQANPQ